MTPVCAGLKAVRRAGAALVLAALLSLGAAFPGSVRAQGAVAAPAAGSAAVVYPAADWERIAVPEDFGYSSALLEKVRRYADGLETTGLMVVVGGRVLLEYGDVEQVSYVASVRKSILAMLYGKYVENGTIDLSRTLADLGMDDHLGLTLREKQATVEDLITARSGIYHPASNPGDNQADAPPRGVHRPGEYFLYNNWDFNAAGAAFEKMTRKDIYDALEADLAKPIGMQDFDRSIHVKSGDTTRSRYPAYHIRLSTRDMARIGLLMLREGRWQDRQVVPRDWVRRITSVVTPVEQMNPAPLRYMGWGYGYMWWVADGDDTPPAFRGAYSGRGAYGQYITVLPALDMVVAHKTAVPPDRTTTWTEYQGILHRLVAARCGGPEPPAFCRT